MCKLKKCVEVVFGCSFVYFLQKHEQTDICVLFTIYKKFPNGRTKFMYPTLSLHDDNQNGSRYFPADIQQRSRIARVAFTKVFAVEVAEWSGVVGVALADVSAIPVVEWGGVVGVATAEVLSVPVVERCGVLAASGTDVFAVEVENRL